MASGSGRPDTAPAIPSSRDSDSDELAQQRQNQRLQLTKPRIPTFKEFGETIKNLEHENFQLKVRLFMHEDKNGKPQSQNGGSGNAEQSSHSASTIELMREFQNLKISNETLQLKLGESENRLRSLQQQLEEDMNEKEDLISRNDMLVERLDILDRELALLKLRKQEDDEIERCVRAYTGENDVYYAGSVGGPIHVPSSTQFLEIQGQHMEEMEKAKQSWQKEKLALIRQYEEEVKEKEEAWDEERASLIKKCNEEEKEREESNAKFLNMVRICRDVGNKLKEEQNSSKSKDAKIDDLKKSVSRQIEAYKKLEKKAGVNLAKHEATSGRLSRTKNVVDMLQTRLKELILFMETLLALEAQGIVSLALTPANRDKLRESLGQSQMLSDTLVKTLADNWDEEEQQEADKLKSSKLGRMNAQHVQIPRNVLKNNNLSDGGDVQGMSASSVSASSSKTSAISTAAKSIQCDPESKHSSEATTSQILELTSEKKKLEDAKNRLVTEKAQLYARVAALEANLNAIKELSYPLQIDNLNLQIEKRTVEKEKLEKKLVNQDQHINQLGTENRALFERLQKSESALRRLHHQQERLVKELDDLKTVCPMKDSYEKIINAGLNKENRQDSSPDLGIESGHDAPSTVSSPKNEHANVKSSEEYKMLKDQNRQLSSKLKHTKLALAKTLEKLSKSEAQAPVGNSMQQYEKALCRELHHTHSVLKEAQVQLESDETPQKLTRSPFHLKNVSNQI